MRTSNSGGFALPWTLMALVLLALMASVGFLVAWLDGRAARAFRHSAEAFYVAQGGLALALATAAGPNPALAPVSVGEGEAVVSFDPVLELRPGEALYRLESRGTVAVGADTFERAVGQLAWVAGPPTLPSALLLRGGAVGASPTGEISGLDPFGAACPEQPSPAAGVAYWGGPPPSPSAALTIIGSPASLALDSAVSLAAETGLRWDDLLSPHGPLADATVPPDPWPGAGAGGGWPLIRLPGSASLDASFGGSGALVAEGDLTLEGGFAWRGIILVGGALRLAGDVSIDGAVAAGLEGSAPAAVDFNGHRIDLALDACAATAAAARLTAPTAPLPGTWFETW